MSLYVIYNYDNRSFVAPPGSDRSFTKDLQKAAVFTSEEKAYNRGVCSNETVRLINDFLNIVE